MGLKEYFFNHRKRQIYIEALKSVPLESVVSKASGTQVQESREIR